MSFLRKNEFRNKIQHYKRMLWDLFKNKKKVDESRKVDEASRESMDASDPPGRPSQTEINLH